MIVGKTSGLFNLHSLNRQSIPKCSTPPRMLLIFCLSIGLSLKPVDAAYPPQKLLEPVFVQNIISKERDSQTGELWYTAGVFLDNGDYVFVRMRASTYQNFRQGKNLAAGYFPVLPSLNNLTYFRSRLQ